MAWEGNNARRKWHYVGGGVKVSFDMQGLAFGEFAAKRIRKRSPEIWKDMLEHIATIAKRYWTQAYTESSGFGYNDRVMPTIYSGELGAGVEFRVSPAGNRLLYINRTPYAHIIEEVGLQKGELGLSIPKKGMSQADPNVGALRAWAIQKLGIRKESDFTRLVHKIQQYGYAAPSPLKEFTDPAGRYEAAFMAETRTYVALKMRQIFGTELWLRGRAK